jgi:diguanylate cyclase (GGDEF)-like protein/PAS domain S-box-containing protein
MQKLSYPNVSFANPRKINNQRQVQHELQEQTAILQSFYTSSPLMMGIVELSQNDIFNLSINQATATFLNTTVDFIQGRWSRDLGMSEAHIKTWIEYYHRSQVSGQPVRFEYAYTKTETEETVWLSVVVSFIGIGSYWRPRFSYVAEDISDRKEIELELHTKTHELDQFFTASIDLLCITDTEGYFHRLSQQWQDILGYSINHLEGSRFLDYVHPDDLSATLEAIHRLGNQKTALHFKNRYRCKDGSYRWLEWRSINIENLIYSTARDITDQRQFELDLKTAKEQIDLVLKVLSGSFSDWDLITKNIYFSPQFKSMIGYSEDELEDSRDMWNSVILQADRENSWQFLEDYNSGKVDQFCATQRYHHKNGSIVYVLTRATPIKDEQGQVIRIVESYLDITELVTTKETLKVSEAKLSSVLNSSLDGIMAFQSVRNFEGKIIDFEWTLSNPAACRMIGRSEGYLMGKRLLEEMPGNQDEGLFEGYVHTVETGEPYQREFYYNHDGIESCFEAVAVKLEDGFAVTFRNVTTLKQSEQKLYQLNDELESRVTDLAQRHTEMVTLNEISDFLHAAATVEEACYTITSLVEDLFPHCAGDIFIARKSHDRLENMSHFGPYFSFQMDLSPHECWGIRRGQIHHVEADYPSLRCQHIPSEADLAATLCIPMIVQGETLGLFYLATKNADVLDDAKQQLAYSLAEQVGMAVANLNLKETLKHQSIRDPLTGLYNRRYLEETFTQEVERAERKQQSVGVIMLDIDHFKRLNDTFGHDVGDFVLQLVADLLRENVRKSDIVCRYGGEEMTVILPEATLAETVARAETLRHALSHLHPRHQGQSLGMLTASFGVAAFPNHGSTRETLLKAADTALYKAKAGGRNQVLVVPSISS